MTAWQGSYVCLILFMSTIRNDSLMSKTYKQYEKMLSRMLSIITPFIPGEVAEAIECHSLRFCHTFVLRTLRPKPFFKYLKNVYLERPLPAKRVAFIQSHVSYYFKHPYSSLVQSQNRFHSTLRWYFRSVHYRYTSGHVACLI